MNTYTYRKRLCMWHDHGVTRNSARRSARVDPFLRALLSALPVWEADGTGFHSVVVSGSSNFVYSGNNPKAADDKAVDQVVADT